MLTLSLSQQWIRFILSVPFAWSLESRVSRRRATPLPQSTDTFLDLLRVLDITLISVFSRPVALESWRRVVLCCVLYLMFVCFPRKARVITKIKGGGGVALRVYTVANRNTFPCQCRDFP